MTMRFRYAVTTSLCLVGLVAMASADDAVMAPLQFNPFVKKH